MKRAFRILEILEELFRSPGPITRANGSTCGMYRLASSLAAALLDVIFEHSAKCCSVVPHVRTIEALACQNSFSVA